MASLELYLFRHGLAEEGSPDELRPLSPLGQQRTGQVARRLQSMSMQVDAILTSPLVRARETAAILQEAGLGPGVVLEPELAPGGDCLCCLRALAHTSFSQVMLVGHEPSLSSWAELLGWGQVRGHLILKKAGIIGVHLPERSVPVGEIFWLSAPKFLL